MADKARGTWVDPRRADIALETWAETWIAGKSHLKPKTLEGYESLLRIHILPPLGATTIGSLRSEDIGTWLSGLKASGLSSSRVHQAFNVLHGMLGLATDYERLTRNPASAKALRKDLPRIVEQEMQFLTAQQVETLAKTVPQEYEALIWTLAVGGLRWGEATALRRRRVDILGGRLHVVESASEVYGKLLYGSPKSGRSRWVEIPRFVSTEIGVHMNDAADDPDALIFTTARNKPLRNSNFTKRVWRPALKEAGIADVTRIHDLRHTAASLMIQDGAPLFLLQRQLGHASIVTTQRYAHLYPSQGTELTDRIDARFRSISGVGVGLEEALVVPMSR